MTNCASDSGELEPALQGIDPSIGKPEVALADNGYLNGDAIERVEDSGVEVYMPVTSEDGNNERRYDFRPPKDKKKKEFRDKRLVAMQSKMATAEARKIYKNRKQTVEPVFGIIKAVMGFRNLHVRGLENVSTEWSLVTLAYNFKRLYALSATATG